MELDLLDNIIYPPSVLAVLDREMNRLGTREGIVAEILAMDALYGAVWRGQLEGMELLSHYAPETASAIRQLHGDL